MYASSVQMALLLNSIKHLKEINTNYSQTVLKISEEETLPNSFYEITIT